MKKTHFLAVVTLATAAILIGYSVTWAVGPVLLDPSKRGVSVVWEGTGQGEILYGLSEDSLDQSLAVQSEDIGVFRGKIECLKPDTQYFYQVRSLLYESDVYSFMTGVEPETPFRFVAFGDTRTNRPEHEAVIEAIRAEAVPFVLHNGDLVDIAVFVWEWDEFFDIEHRMLRESVFVPVMGNHEMWAGQPFFRRYFNTPDHGDATSSVYSFQYGNTFFINLDIARLYTPGSDQYGWLVDQLILAESIPSVKHCVVQAHFPPYSASNHGSDVDVMLYRTTIAPLLTNFGVDLVFGGHDHNYQHNQVEGVDYFVLGGGGAPLYGVDPEAWTIAYERSNNYLVIDVNGEVINLTAKRADGTIIEEYMLENDFGGQGIGEELPVPCADGDWDEDGLTDGEEYAGCTDPYDADTDGDGYNDGDEVLAGTDPCDENSYPGSGDDDDDDNDDNDDDTGGDDDDDDDNDNDDDDDDDDNNDDNDDDDDDSGCGC